MRGPHNIWRLMRTAATFERTGAMHIILEKLNVPPSVRIAARIIGWPFKFFGLKGDLSQPPMLRALSALGPVYIKFGQLMSTRPDVVGVDMANELKVLQDKIPPFTKELAIAEIENELGVPLEEIYINFSEPVAAASIAQVHKATLVSNGKDVAVKVLRPNIERDFRKDIDAFYFGAYMIELLSPASRRLKPKAVIRHFDSIVKGELDLRMEASAASEFAENTKNDKGFHVPGILWQYSAQSVMTLDWVEGISVGDLQKLHASGVDMDAFSARIIQMFLRHALRDGFFHADMHQGNLKLAPNGDLIALDFGIMGRIDEYTRRAYAEILMGFISKDYRRVAEVHFEAGYISADQDIDAFTQALRSVGEPIFGHDAEQISMARLLTHLFDVTERFGMETRTELILLQRTMVVVEGVARSINPELNMWEVSKPEIEHYIATSLGPRAMVRDLTKLVKILSRFGPQLPSLIEKTLHKSINPDINKTTNFHKIGIFLAGGAIASAISLVLYLL